MRLAKNRMHFQRPLCLAWIVWGLSAGLYACSSNDLGATQSSETGMLVLTANGEEFVRQGLRSRDQWQVDFDQVYVTFDQVLAAQEPLKDVADEQSADTVVPSVQWEGPKTINLVAGETPQIISQISAPVGQYRALTWQMSPAKSGPAQDTSILIAGKATKETETLAFTLRLEPTLEFRCGAYVGDDRKGIVQPQQSAELEATFHFDHLFGNGDAPADDDINRDSLGIEPLAELTESETLDADLEMLLAELSPEDSNKLQEILSNLGHVGEGHCEAKIDE